MTEMPRAEPKGHGSDKFGFECGAAQIDNFERNEWLTYTAD